MHVLFPKILKCPTFSGQNNPRVFINVVDALLQFGIDVEQEHI